MSGLAAVAAVAPSGVEAAAALAVALIIGIVLGLFDDGARR